MSAILEATLPAGKFTPEEMVAQFDGIACETESNAASTTDQKLSQRRTRGVAAQKGASVLAADPTVDAFECLTDGADRAGATDDTSARSRAQRTPHIDRLFRTLVDDGTARFNATRTSERWRLTVCVSEREAIARIDERWADIGPPHYSTRISTLDSRQSTRTRHSWADAPLEVEREEHNDP